MDEKVIKYQKRAEKLEQEATKLDNKRRNISDLIPFGQPVLVGHHSESKSRSDISKIDRLMQKSIEVTEKAEYWQRRAEHREKRLHRQAETVSFCSEKEGVIVGDKVIAKFTNRGLLRQFEGEIVGFTKNEWKVKSITSPYPTEQAGRVFYIPNISNRKYSTNNCVVKF